MPQETTNTKNGMTTRTEGQENQEVQEVDDFKCSRLEAGSSEAQPNERTCPEYGAPVCFRASYQSERED